MFPFVISRLLVEHFTFESKYCREQNTYSNRLALIFIVVLVVVIAEEKHTALSKGAFYYVRIS